MKKIEITNDEIFIPNTKLMFEWKIDEIIALEIVEFRNNSYLNLFFHYKEVYK